MKRRLYSVAISAVALGVMAAMARADVKLISEVKVTGVPAAASAQGAPDLSKPMLTTTYYKGSKTRVESGNVITITDYETGKVTTLNPDKKTFYTSNIGDAMKAMADNPMLAMIKIDATADVKPGGKSKTIAGKPATNYLITSTMKMTMDGAPPEAAAMMPTITMKQEMWTTEALALTGWNPKMLQTNFSKNLPPFLMSGMKPFIEKMSSVKGFQLSSTMTMTFESKSGAAMPGLPKEPIVTTTEVKEISEAPLDDALFTVPGDYKEVQPPTPGTPLPGGRGGATPPGTRPNPNP
jgi:hypothetical protein